MTNNAWKVSVFGVICSTFYCILTEYGEILCILCISPYSVQMWENGKQNNSEDGHFLRREYFSQSKFPTCYEQELSYDLWNKIVQLRIFYL